VTPSKRLLVAGIGNVWLGDDGFGPAVAQQLAARALPDGVRAVDFGTRAFDLACALCDGWETVVLVDAVRRGQAPGTLYLLALDEVRSESAVVAAHALDPLQVLGLARALAADAPLPALRLLGCEAESVGSDEELVDGLSPAVAAAVEPAVARIAQLIDEHAARPLHA
jgi:hydrogenase maturation protease